MIRVYYLPNADGTHSNLVAAENQKAAVELMRVTPGEFRRYGGRRVDADDSRFAEFIAVATSKPGVVWTRKIGTTEPWREETP